MDSGLQNEVEQMSETLGSKLDSNSPSTLRNLVTPPDSETEANEAAYVLLGIRGREMDKEAAQTLLGFSNGDEEVEESEDEDSDVEKGVLYLRCHGKDTCFKATDGNAVHALIQARHEKASILADDAYVGETRCRICKRDRKIRESRYPADDGDDTEGQGSAADDLAAERWGAGRYDSSRYHRAEFGSRGEVTLPVPERRRDRTGSAAAKKDKQGRNGNAITRGGKTATRSATRSQESFLSTPAKRKASEEVNEYGQGRRVKVGGSPNTPIRAPTVATPASMAPRFERELNMSLLREPMEDDFPEVDPTTGLRKSRRVRKQTFKASENSSVP